MVFTKRLREGIRSGEITCTVRFWLDARVTVGKRYPMEEGAIETRAEANLVYGIEVGR